MSIDVFIGEQQGEPIFYQELVLNMQTVVLRDILTKYLKTKYKSVDDVIVQFRIDEERILQSIEVRAMVSDQEESTHENNRPAGASAF